MFTLVKKDSNLQQEIQVFEDIIEFLSEAEYTGYLRYIADREIVGLEMKINYIKEKINDRTIR